MNILLATTVEGPQSPGAAYLVNLSRGLERLGMDLTWLLSDARELDAVAERASANTLVLRQPALGRNSPGGRRTRGGDELQARLADVGADLVHVDQHRIEDGLDLASAVADMGLPLVRSIQDARAPGGVLGLARRWSLGRSVARDTDPVIVMADAEAELLAGWMPGDCQRRIRRIHPGVPAPTPTMGARLRQRERLGIGKSEGVVGVCAPLDVDHDPLFMLEVLGVMDRRSCCPHLVWIGSGPLHTQFQDRVGDLGLNARVSLLDTGSSRVEPLAAVDVFCAPFRHAAVPSALLEAMRMGTCCIVNEVGGLREAIQPDRSGIVLPVADASGWASTLETVLSDPEFRTALGEGALKAARSRFNLGRMASETEAVYQSLLFDQALDATEE